MPSARVIHETDALKTALGFVAQLDHRLMTSTASRLAVVQRGSTTAALTPTRKAAPNTSSDAS
jgi:hypothetical protein